VNKYELVIENEAYFLGCILKDPSLLDETRLAPRHFISVQNKELFKSMSDLKKEGHEIDVISLAQLGESRTMKFGGTPYLSTLMNSVPSIHSFKNYENNILDFHTIQDAQGYVNDFLDKTRETYNTKELSKLVQHISEIESSTVRSNKSFKEKLFDRMEHHSNTPKKGLSGINTGYLGLNRFTDGWQRTDLIIVAARPSVGKTALVLNSILNGCKKDQNLFATFFSIEMAEGLIIDRLIASEGRLNTQKMRNPNKTFGPEEWDRYSHAVGLVEKLNVDIRDESTVPEIRAAIRKNIREHPNKNHVVALDFLTLVKHTSPSGNKHQDITDIIRDFKQIAKDLNVPFIVIAQLNRAVESRANKRPTMSDLTESGSIEQIADLVALLYRDDYYNKEEKDEAELIEIIIDKNRQGMTGTVKMKFAKKTNTYYDLV
jgi:replicative DNA helicase